MTPEVAGSIGVGIVLAGSILHSARDRSRDIAGLRERMARLEGVLDGFAGRTQGSGGRE